MNKSPFPLLSILDVPLHSVTMDETVDYLDGLMDQEEFHLVVTLGTEMVMRAQWDPEFLATVQQASLVVPDSIGVIWAPRYKGFSMPERVPGVDLTVALARKMAAKNRSVFLLGSQPGVAADAAQRLKELAPGIRIAGNHHGYFKDDQEMVRLIRETKPDLLLASLGFPKQENWLLEYGPQIGAKVGIGVGGTLDVLAGRLSRAPRWVQRFGLEWLYRVIRQPQRIPRLVSLPHFALKVLVGDPDVVQQITSDTEPKAQPPT